MSPTDRAFRFGMSVFETVAIRRGAPLFLGEHIALLTETVHDLGGAVPACLPETVREVCRDAEDGVVRIYVTAGEGDFGAPFRGTVYLLREAMPLGVSTDAKVVTSSAIHLPAPGGRKSGNYWANADAVAQARRQGADDALLFDPCGQLVGAATANVFLRIDGIWHTPPVESGARRGVVRQWILETFGALESPLVGEALASADAVLLTNSRIGVRPVGEVDGRPLTTCRTFSEVYRETILGS